MGHVTVIHHDDQTLVTAIRGLVILSTATANAKAARVKVKRVEISQRDDTTLEMISGVFSTRTGGVVTATATTPLSTRPLIGAASGLTGNTAPVAGAGRSGTAITTDTTPTYVDHHAFEFANLNGYLWKPDPEEEIEIPASTIWVCRLTVDPTTLTGWTISVTLEEN